MTEIFSHYPSYMIVYMVNIVAEVITLPDENGFDHMTDLYLNLQAQNKHEAKVKLALIVAAMEELGLVSKDKLPKITDKRGLFFNLETPPIDGKTYSFRRETVKALRESPVYELRLNIPTFNWRFRATFFPKEHPDNGQQFYCFVYPFEKVNGQPDPTDGYRDKTKDIYLEVETDFERYRQYFDNLDE